mgnify:CR=1 FL=1
MNDLTHLRTLAEQATKCPHVFHPIRDGCPHDAFIDTCSPTTVLALLDTIERLREALKDIDVLGCNCSNLPLSGVQHFPRCPRYIIREVFAALSQDEAGGKA